MFVILHKNNVPANVTVQKDIVYGSVGKHQLKLDVYRPKSDALLKAAPLPAVVMIHGGGWREGSKADMGSFSIGLAQKDYVCFSVDYRLIDRGRNH